MRELVLFLGVGAVAIAAGCGTTGNAPADTLGGLFDGGRDDVGGGAGSSGGVLPPDDGGTPSLLGDASLGDSAAATTTADPVTCDQAAQSHTYVGCDYWPTVVANNVWAVFDFAVVVANAGTSTATVTVTGPSNTNQTTTVPPQQLAKIYLPWVPALKGPDSDNCGTAVPLTSSVMSPAGAFHLVSSVPVTVYQFNALEYVGQGGPPGKTWASCPGNTLCVPPAPFAPQAIGCYSFSNDASLLLPSTAMTGNYRVAGHEGLVVVDATGQPVPNGSIGGYMAVTGTQNGTTVTVKVSNAGRIAAGNMGIAATAAGGTLTFTLNAGDVAELLGPGAADLSGSIVHASAPVQVITGHPCYEIPPAAQACDHMEESVFPAETLGKDYVVTRPAGPNGGGVPHQVRFYGNFDNTHLTYSPPTPPPGCPTTLAAGQVVECGVGGVCPSIVDLNQTYNCGTIDQDFEVTGDQPFAVGLFTLGASIVDPNTVPPNQKGDPAQSFATAVEQYRTKYVFLAPDDYPVSYVDIVAKSGTSIMLDNQTVTVVPQAVGTGGYAVYRVKLGAGQAGAHVLSASQPVGIQVVGYGSYTSYMYPGGLNLVRIAPPPAIQ
jgi:IgGFc binding protein